jgi:hypothetical protein
MDAMGDNDKEYFQKCMMPWINKACSSFKNTFFKTMRDMREFKKKGCIG